MTIGIPQCASCKHYRPKEKDMVTCDAFPGKWIPDEIVLGDFDHRKKHPDDNGILYEKGTPE